MQILIALVLSLAVLATAAAADQPAPGYGLKNVWPGTWIYPPHRQGLPFRVGDKAKWDKAVASIASPVPAVIYVHGCAGFSWDFLEAAYAKALAKAGFLVLAPDSYARDAGRQARQSHRMDPGKCGPLTGAIPAWRSAGDGVSELF